MNQAVSAVASPQDGENIDPHHFDLAAPAERVLGHHVLEQVEVTHHDLTENAGVN